MRTFLVILGNQYRDCSKYGNTPPVRLCCCGWTYCLYRCVNESGDFNNVMNSKLLHLSAFNTYEYSVNTYIKACRFSQLTLWKQKSISLLHWTLRANKGALLGVWCSVPLNRKSGSPHRAVLQCCINCWNGWEQRVVVYIEREGLGMNRLVRSEEN
jgi:hypothetical protein